MGTKFSGVVWGCLVGGRAIRCFARSFWFSIGVFNMATLSKASAEFVQALKEDTEFPYQESSMANDLIEQIFADTDGKWESDDPEYAQLIADWWPREVIGRAFLIASGEGYTDAAVAAMMALDCVPCE